MNLRTAFILPLVLFLAAMTEPDPVDPVDPTHGYAAGSVEVEVKAEQLGVQALVAKKQGEVRWDEAQRLREKVTTLESQLKATETELEESFEHGARLEEEIAMLEQEQGDGGDVSELKAQLVALQEEKESLMSHLANMVVSSDALSPRSQKL